MKAGLNEAGISAPLGWGAFKDPFQRLADSLDAIDQEWRKCPAYYLFEGWDVGARPQGVYDQALRDGIDLHANYLVNNVGEAPHKFQNGYLLSTKRGRVVVAGSQLGKTMVAVMEMQMRITGKIPFAYRFAAGYDTGIPRLITKENIRRFGRRSVEDQSVVFDHNENAALDESWNCGNVEGRGVFPSSKILDPGSMIRLGCPQKIFLQNWWPTFTGKNAKGIGPFLLPDFVDKSRGTYAIPGANRQDAQIMCVRNCTVQILTYESGEGVFEGILVPTWLDEEPKPRGAEILNSVITHCTDYTIMETPIWGITWSEKIIFPKDRTPDSETFHATIYDSPYKTESEIRFIRNSLVGEEWNTGARLYGIPTEQKGKPYYDRNKLNIWLQNFKAMDHRLVTFSPVTDWFTIKTDPRMPGRPGLLDIPVKIFDTDKEDMRSVWRLYEDRKPGVAYASASDQAEGAETVEEAGDWSACSIGRRRDEREHATEPVLCATLRSSLPIIQFAREVLYAARYFNNAMLAPESAKGSANGSFMVIADDWPWWFMDTIEKQSTRKPKEFRGFSPTGNRREILFDVLGRDWFDRFEVGEYPLLHDEYILSEAAAAVVGWTAGKKQTRCDHPDGGTIDSLTAYLILHFIMQKEFYGQLRCHGGPDGKQAKSWFDRADEANRPKRPAGFGATMTDMHR